MVIIISFFQIIIIFPSLSLFFFSHFFFKLLKCKEREKFWRALDLNCNSKFEKKPIHYTSRSLSTEQQRKKKKQLTVSRKGERDGDQLEHNGDFQHYRLEICWTSRKIESSFRMLDITGQTYVLVPVVLCNHWIFERGSMEPLDF